jgi:Fe-S cluster assembly protein SufD
MVVALEKGAELEFVEELSGGGTDARSWGLWLVRAAGGASAKVSAVQLLEAGTRAFERRYLSAAASAQVDLLETAVGAGQWQGRVETECFGPGARVGVKAAVRGAGSQQFDFWVTARHGVERSSSAVEHWAAVGGRAKSTFNGNLVITHEGVKTDAFQKSRGLLLSREAQANAVPKLEIATDDVACAHGASVAPIGDEQLFYLESRGLPRAEAERMIIDGFIEPVASLLPSDGLRARIQDRIQSEVRP